MRRSIILTVLLVMASAGASLAAVNDVDKAFVPMAMRMAVGEIQSGQLAERRTDFEPVKLFAQRMILDHSEARKALQQITGADPSFPEPPKHSAGQREDQNDLQDLTGPAFNRAYVALQIQRHEAAIPEFEQEAAHGANMELRQYAVKQLAVLRDHLEMARKLAAQIANR
ncbi:MAG: DUF4142 domain-containing protein [Acetobacteraceae bacterium]